MLLDVLGKEVNKMTHKPISAKQNLTNILEAYAFCTLLASIGLYPYILIISRF